MFLNYSTAFHIHDILRLNSRFQSHSPSVFRREHVFLEKRFRRPRTNSQPSITMRTHRFAATCVLAAVIFLRLPKTAARPIAQQMNASLSTTPIMLDWVLRLTEKKSTIRVKTDRWRREETCARSCIRTFNEVFEGIQGGECG